MRRWIQKPLLGVQINWANLISKGLVYYPLMNEGMGNRIYDLSGNNNVGILTNMAFPPTISSGWNPSKFGSGLAFDGTSDYVNCGSGPSLSISGPLTVGAWVNVTLFLAQVYSRIIQRANGDSNGFSLRTINSLTTGRFSFQAKRYSATYNAYADSVYALNTWYHLVGVYDGSNVFLYINGIKQTSTLSEDAGDGGGTVLNIGRRANAALQFYSGLIDNVMIWNRALSQSEIQQLYIEPFCLFNKTSLETIYLPIPFNTIMLGCEF